MLRAKARLRSSPLRARCRTVLILDGDPHGAAPAVRTSWFRGDVGRAVDAMDAPDAVSAVQGTLADGCARAPVRDGEPVTLVIRDAPLDIERLASRGFAATPLGAWQRHRLARTRRRERHDGQVPATLAWLGRHASSDARAAVQRETIDPVWAEWLEPLVRDGLVIARTVLPEQLLAAAHARRAVPRFTALLEARHVRHVLVIDGVACFSRRIALPDDPHAIARDIVASLTHALDRWSLTRVALDATGLPAGVTSVLDTLVGEVPALIEPDAGPATTGAGGPCPDRTLARLAIDAAGRARECVTLAPLGDAWRERTTLRRLGLACVAGCVLVLGVAAHAIALGPDGVTRARALDAQRASVHSSLLAMRAGTAALHPQPERAARFLIAFERLGESVDTSPDQLLVDIARALTRHEGLTLDAIAWSHRALDADEDRDGAGFDDAVFTDASALPLAHRGDAARLAVELDGRVSDAAALRDAQAQVHAFVDEVRTIAVLHDCRIMASPLSGAARGDGAPVPSAIDIPATAPVWRVRCVSARGAS